MNSASATLGNTAGIFGSYQAEMIPQYPQKRCIVFNVNVMIVSINSKVVVCHLLIFDCLDGKFNQILPFSERFASLFLSLLDK
jgi:hypothetical protein